MPLFRKSAGYRYLDAFVLANVVKLFSNFRVREDAATGDLIVTLSRYDVERIPADFTVPAGAKTTRENAYTHPTAEAVVPLGRGR